MRTYVVTGAGSAIGRAIIGQLQSEGCRIIATDLTETELAEPVSFIEADLSSPAGLNRLVAGIKSENTALSGLVHVAMLQRGGLDTCTYDEFMSVYAVAAAAPYYLVQQLQPSFGPEAAIVLIGSTRAYMSQPQSESYAAAKGGLFALNHALAMSLRGSVRVNLISPGWIQKDDDAAVTAADRQSQPVGRIGQPADVAALCAFLLSPKAGFITGAAFTLDGGMTRQMIYPGEFGWSFAHEKGPG